MATLRCVLIFACGFVAQSFSAKTSGCGKSLPVVQREPSTDPCVDSYLTQYRQKNGVQRSYRVHIPATYNKNEEVSLIFSFHGHNKTACGQEQLSEFSNPRWNPDGIAVYPQGLDRQWQGDPDSHNVDDVAFVSDMIESFSELYCIDDSKIYATGKSNGGGFTGGVLACDSALSSKIAAFAPVSGAFYVPDSSSKACDDIKHTVTIPCNNSRNDIPILEFHGGEDHTIYYDGGGRRKECLPTVPHWIREWSRRENLGSKNLTTSSYDGHVMRYQYGGDNGKLGIVQHYYIDNLGHDWPSTRPNRDNTGHTYINATRIIMEFFQNYTLEGKVER